MFLDALAVSMSLSKRCFLDFSKRSNAKRSRRHRKGKTIWTRPHSTNRVVFASDKILQNRL